MPNPDTHIVVNCAGRTRGLLGAQSLINAKVPNKVSALKGGTMGWELAQFKLQYGQDRYSAFPSVKSIAVADNSNRNSSFQFNLLLPFSMHLYYIKIIIIQQQ